MKQRTGGIAKLILLLVITADLFFCGETWAALPAKKAALYAIATGDTANTSPVATTAFTAVSGKQVHLSFFRRLRLARDVVRLQHRRRENSVNGIVSLALAAGSLLSFITLFALAATAGVGLLTALFFLGTFTAIAAIALGGVGIHNDRYRSFAIIGLVLGISELLFFVAVGLLVLILATAL